jgi:hypothetical protein
MWSWLSPTTTLLHRIILSSKIKLTVRLSCPFHFELTPSLGMDPQLVFPKIEDVRSAAFEISCRMHAMQTTKGKMFLKDLESIIVMKLI